MVKQRLCLKTKCKKKLIFAKIFFDNMKYKGPIPTNSPAPETAAPEVPAAQAAPTVEQPPAQTQPETVVQSTPAQNAEPTSTPQASAAPTLPDWLLDSTGNPYTKEQFEAFKAASTKASEYEIALQEYQQRIKPASPLIQKMNEMAERGASTEELQIFIGMQRIEPDQLDPLQAIRMAAKLENPDFDDAQIDAYLSIKHGLSAYIEGEDPSAKDTVALKLAQREAVAKLKDLKVKSEQPVSVQDKLKAEQEFAQRQQQVLELVKKATPEQAKFSVNDSLSLDFSINQEAKSFIQNSLAEAILSGQVSPEQAPDMAVRLAAMFDPNALVKTATLHGYAKGKEDALREVSGLPSAPGTRPAPTEKPAQTRPKPGQLIM